MKNLRLYQTEGDYTSDPITREYPTVSYCKENDMVYIVTKSPFEFVDLGLPSGLKWATCNVGATKPEEFGLYFAWGETQGYTGITDEKQFSWTDYKWCADPYTNAMAKYNETDGLTTLELVDDAVTAVDSGCRIPTESELKELTASTTSEWIENYNESGVSGMLFTASNGNSIFVPAAGNCSGGLIFSVGQSGNLWSSSLGSISVRNAWFLGFSPKYIDVTDVEAARFLGGSLRAIKE